MRYGRAPARARTVRQECVHKKLRAWHMHRHIKFNLVSSTTRSEGTVERRQARFDDGDAVDGGRRWPVGWWEDVEGDEGLNAALERCRLPFSSFFDVSVDASAAGAYLQMVGCCCCGWILVMSRVARS